MARSRFAQKTDGVALAVTLYLVLYILFSRLYDMLLAAALAALTLLVLMMLWAAAFKGRRQSTALRRAEKAEAAAFWRKLPYCTENAARDMLYATLGFYGYEPLENGLFSKAGKTYTAVLATDGAPFARGGAMACARRIASGEADGALIFCDGVHPSAREALRPVRRADIRFFDRNTTYALIKKAGALPPAPAVADKKPSAVKAFLSLMFRRDRFKGYFFLAVILFLFSFITPLKNYYLFSAAALFVLSAACLLSGNGNGGAKDNVL